MLSWVMLTERVNGKDYRYALARDATTIRGIEGNGTDALEIPAECIFTSGLVESARAANEYAQNLDDCGLLNRFRIQIHEYRDF